MTARVYTINKEVALQLTREQCLSNLNAGFESCKNFDVALLIAVQIEAVQSMSDEDYRGYLAVAYTRLMELEHGSCHNCGTPLYDEVCDGDEGLCSLCYSEINEEL